MKVLLDTNVILDAITARKPWKDVAQQIILLVAEEKIEGFITANCITDIYYIARKSLSDTDAREALRNLFLVFSVVDLCGTDCKGALDVKIEDYEDAVVVICAQKARIEYIITRDEDFLQSGSKPSAISPQAFLDMYMTT